MPELLYRNGDLNQFPTTKIANKSTHISLGDLHGNALKLIYTLVEENILELNEEQYHSLRAIYNTPVDALTQSDLETFQELIDQAKVNTKKALLLIGDDLADRGNNDWFTLIVLQKLQQSGLDIEVLLSNHSAEFLRDYELIRFTGTHSLLVTATENQAQSLTNLHRLISRGLIDEEKVRDLVKTSYKPMVKAISYTRAEDGSLTLFTHAPVGLETIKALSAKWGLAYSDATPEELMHSIDAINEQVQHLFSEGRLADEIDNEGGWGEPSLSIPPKTHSLTRLIWNRAIGAELDMETKGRFAVNFVHGHIGPGSVKDCYGDELPQHTNLDNYFGKTTRDDKTDGKTIQHFTGHSNDLSALQLQ